MAIKVAYFIWGLLMPMVLINLGCKKQISSCSKMGYEFMYSKPGVIYSPGIDSFLLGNEITIEAAAPKSFYDEEKGYVVIVNETQIHGPLGIQKLITNPIITRAGAIEDVELTPIKGYLVKDTSQFSQGQLENFRTAYWISDSDSFRLKIVVKPKIKGTFIIALNQQGNRDKDCALYKYFLKVINSNQHLYFLQSLYGYIPQDDRTYCFKVY
jgi:hypothetical protein